MSLNSTNPRKGYATEASLDLNVFLEFEEYAGETYFQVCMDSESPNVKDMHVVRDLLTDYIDSQAPKLTLVPTEVTGR